MTETVGDFLIDRLHAWVFVASMAIPGRHQRRVGCAQSRQGKNRVQFRSATKRWLRSWHPLTPSLQVNSGWLGDFGSGRLPIFKLAL